MLPKERISGIKILTDEWRKARAGMFTSSRISALISEKQYTAGFMNYIYQKVGEELGITELEDKFETEAMRWGIFHEQDAMQKFGQQKGVEYIIAQQLITVPGTRYGCTPDALILHGESEDGTAYNVSTVEVKCYPVAHRFIPLSLCTAPVEVKKVSPDVYWQVLDQMDNCDCLVGYSVAYHPEIKAGNLSIVEYRKRDLLEDFRLLKDRKRLASEKFDEIRDKLLSRGVV